MAISKVFAVGYYSLFDNDLILKAVEATDWRDAVRKHPSTRDYLLDDDIETMSLDDVKELFFNADAALEVIEVGIAGAAA